MASHLGSLVQSCCGEGGALQTNVTGACGEHPQCSSHTGFAPAHGSVLSPSALLRLPAALYGAGPALRAVPIFGYSTKRGLGWGCVLCLPRPEWLRLPGA